MLGRIIGGAVGAAGSIFGGISASKAMKKVKNNLLRQQQQNRDWYDQRYNEDATQRADAQRILSLTQQAIRQRNREAAGAQAVMGGTPESLAATNAANSQTIAQATSHIAAAGDSRKDQIEQAYQQREGQLQGQLNDVEINKAKAMAEAVQGVAQAGAGIAGLF